MTSFRFIHAADLHLGSPLTGLAMKDASVAERLATASRDAFTSLIDQAISLKIDFVVIAGDLYDGAWKDNHIGLFFNREVAKLSRSNIPVYFLRGNHDAESIVTRTIAMPEGVYEFSTRKPETYFIEELGVALHGQGFADRSVNDNLALSYPAAVAGYFNIGVLHTSLSGRPPHAPYAPCTPEDLRSRGYNYWALGHVHAFEEVLSEPLTIYPGVLQGRNIRETGEKGAVLVTIDDGNISYDRLIVDHARFELKMVSITPDMANLDILSVVEEAVSCFSEAANERPIALRLRLSGEHGSAGRIQAVRRQWHDDVQAVCQRVHADIWLEKLELDLHAPDADQSGLAKDLLVDMDAMIDAVAASDNARHDAEVLIAQVVGKLPPGVAAGDMPLGDPTSDLLEEARAVLRARLNMEGEG